MIIHETQEINSGLLFQGRKLIGIADGGKIEQKYFVPDRFKPVHNMPVRFVGHMDIDEKVSFYETKENTDCAPGV